MWNERDYSLTGNEISLPLKVEEKLNYVWLPVCYVLGCMCFQQRRPRNQTYFYSLSFSLKWWFYLYLLLSAKCYTNSLREETCQWVPGAYGKGSLCPYMPGAIKNSLLSFSLLSPSNSPVTGFHLISQWRVFTSQAVISQAHGDIFFHQTSVFI